MATEFRLNYTGSEINEKLKAVGEIKASLENDYNTSTEVDEKIANVITDVNKTFITKADLVDGKVPIEQIPDDVGSKTIIDVIELPTENIESGSFYRLTSGIVTNTRGELISEWDCRCVDSLPEVGEPVTADMVNVVFYYDMQDGDAYGYIDDNLNMATSVPVGWYTIAALAPYFDITWSGIFVDEIYKDESNFSMYLLLKQDIYFYKNGWIMLENIGRSGIGRYAEVFNHPLNIATGDNSHAEGKATQAVGRSQHVHGEYNIVDPDYTDNTGRSRYVHIVGNGWDDDSRSNAHTLDWNGNAWYAGTVEATAIILSSSTIGSAKKFKIAVDDSGTLTATEI